MDELTKYFGAGSFGLMLGGIVGYLIRLIIDQRLRRELEDHKHTLAVLGKRLDFLHQERGKACLTLVRLMKTAKGYVMLLVCPAQEGPVDQKKAWSGAHRSCQELQNFIAETSLLFPKSIEDQMLKVKLELWRFVDVGGVLLQEAESKEQSPFNLPAFRELWKKLQGDFEPLEKILIAEIRTLLGATTEDD